MRSPVPLKSCDIFDAFSWFTGSRAIKVQGFGGRSVIQPDPDALPRCHLCHRDCPYRRREPGTAAPSAPDLLVHFPSWLQETEEKHMDDVCVYAPGSDLYHKGNIHFSYAKGTASFVGKLIHTRSKP